MDGRTVSEFFAMGEHGVYVWSAYGLSLAALVGLGIWPLASLRAMVERIRKRSAQSTGEQAQQRSRRSE
ncbi:MAG: heme exporter protein CcmD [Pseudomonadales bacterium]|nr:heme exporter protein CcmD [Pseudomonadales bacterium]